MDRRTFLGLMPTASMLLLSTRAAQANQAAEQSILTKPIPQTGEQLPVIGMGTWITFNVGNSPGLRADRIEVLSRFLALGGGMIDSSPMYGSAQSVLGQGLRELDFPAGFFSADKIWTGSTAEGKSQFDDMQELWGLNRFDLVQVHNLVNWQAHLETLQSLKEKGQIRYIGITTSHGLRHEEFENILQNHPLDFIQLTYNITHREVEQRLLPLAAEKGVAVIANRPLDGGRLFDRVQGQPLPAWAAEYDCKSWASLFLKYIVSHPAVTCAIPATSKVAHVEENMSAAYGQLPDAAGRERMFKHIAAL